MGTRHVILPYNENSYVSASIFNLLLASLIAIPLYFILEDIAKWVVVGVAILYAFFGTVVIHFVPKIGNFVNHVFKGAAGISKSNSNSGTTNSIDSATAEQNNMF